MFWCTANGHSLQSYHDYDILGHLTHVKIRFKLTKSPARIRWGYFLRNIIFLIPTSSLKKTHCSLVITSTITLEFKSGLRFDTGLGVGTGLSFHTRMDLSVEPDAKKGLERNKF